MMQNPNETIWKIYRPSLLYPRKLQSGEGEGVGNPEEDENRLGLISVNDVLRIVLTDCKCIVFSFVIHIYWHIILEYSISDCNFFFY